MTRPTFLYIDTQALVHNVDRIKRYAPKAAIIAMVKANAYGCGLKWIVPELAPHVEGFGVACLEEARAVRQYNSQNDCWLFQGIFGPDEIPTVHELGLTVVVHNPQQVTWLTSAPSSGQIKVWVKVDTGMHRLGFHPDELAGVLTSLRLCQGIDKNIGLMTHLGCADTPELAITQHQLELWHRIAKQYPDLPKSVANSAAIIGLAQTHADKVRPGIMLYGASPFADRTGVDLGLQPVMHFVSAVTTIHHYLPGDAIGYGATWQCKRSSIIGLIPVGYGDGYPRHVQENTQVWINGQMVPIVGRISMDMMTVDLTDCPNVKIGDPVELWGKHIPIEAVAHQANTVAYELMTQVTARPKITKV